MCALDELIFWDSSLCGAASFTSKGQRSWRGEGKKRGREEGKAFVSSVLRALVSNEAWSAIQGCFLCACVHVHCSISPIIIVDPTPPIQKSAPQTHNFVCLFIYFIARIQLLVPSATHSFVCTIYNGEMQKIHCIASEGPGHEMCFHKWRFWSLV